VGRSSCLQGTHAAQWAQTKHPFPLIAQNEGRTHARPQSAGSKRVQLNLWLCVLPVVLPWAAACALCCATPMTNPRFSIACVWVQGKKKGSKKGGKKKGGKKGKGSKKGAKLSDAQVGDPPYIKFVRGWLSSKMPSTFISIAMDKDGREKAHPKRSATPL
jgi:hypothetical protein